MERQRHELQAALMENPLPSAEVISARTGLTLKYLGRVHPDLYAQYRDRSNEARRLAASNRRAAFEAEIRSATIEIIDHGLYPSRRRILKAILNPSMRHPKILTRQTAAKLLERKLAWETTSPCSLGSQPGSLSQEPSAGRAEAEP